MKITKLEKNTNFIDTTVKINVEITLDKSDVEYFGSLVGTAFDPVPDDIIPSILEAIGKTYKGRVKNGKITGVNPYVS
jgi:hypothetical protein